MEEELVDHHNQSNTENKNIEGLQVHWSSIGSNKKEIKTILEGFQNFNFLKKNDAIGAFGKLLRLAKGQSGPKTINCDNLSVLLDQSSQFQVEEILNNFLPFGARMALISFEIFKNKSIPFLLQNLESKVVFTREEICCLISLMLFCLVPKLEASRYKTMPKDRDFSKL